jgi:hypothetical protein
MPRTRKSRPKTAPDEPLPPITIGFRLDAASLHLLAAEADKQELSLHEVARRWVLERLENPVDTPAWKEAFDNLHMHVERTRQDFALGFEALLASAGKVTEEDALAWADRNFRKK